VRNTKQHSEYLLYKTFVINMFNKPPKHPDRTREELHMCVTGLLEDTSRGVFMDALDPVTSPLPPQRGRLVGGRLGNRKHDAERASLVR